MNLRKILLFSFAVSGALALIYEITWIRPLQFLLGSTVYTISMIFAAFMLGLSLGSLIISKYIDKIEFKNLPKTYALIQLGIGLYGVLLLSIFNLLPKLYNSLYFLHENFYVFGFVQFVLLFVVLLIPTTLFGTTLPLIARIYVKDGIGKGVGEIYSVNNLGATIGSLLTGFVLIPLLGIRFTIIFATIINLIIGLGIISLVSKNSLKRIALITISIFVVLAIFGNYNIQQMHSGGFYRTHEGVQQLGDVVYYGEGLYSTVTVRGLPEGGYSLFINGKGQGSYEITDLRVNLLLGYLPALVKPDTKNSLVIGLGTGTTSGHLSQTSKTTTVEIESKVVEASDYFRLSNLNVLENPNHELIIADARNYLLKTDEKYDSIVQEPSDPWQSFSTNLYSKEFFELVSDNLNEDGIYVHWVPIYTMSVDDFKSFYKTFNEVFPNTAAFANIKSEEDTPLRFGTTEILLIGSRNEIGLDKNEINANYNSLSTTSKEYLNAIRLSSGEDIYNLLLFTSEDLEGYADDAQIVTDDNLILEFSTPKTVLNQNPGEVIQDIGKFLEENGRVVGGGF